jgi:hypothetical protein
MVRPLPLEHFSYESNYACYRPVAEVDLTQAIDMVDRALRLCSEDHVAGLLVDIRQLTGFTQPSPTERYWFTKKWAETADGKVTLVMISRPELMDPERIGVTMARNRGLIADVFIDESDAVKWLLNEINKA